MPSDLPQPVSYDRFDPLNDEMDESQLPSVREPDAGETAVAATSAGQAADGAATGVAIGAAIEAESSFDSEELTASEAEERRAQQLLDRAFAVWERGDTAGAILACRQSLTLSPRSAPAYSMLGLLLERTDDTNGAIAAYEKAVEIEPSSLLERDSARRLRAAMGQALPTQFHFQDAELFDSIDQEPGNDLATNADDAAASDTPNLPTSASNLPVEPSAIAPVAQAPVTQAPVALSSTRLSAAPSSGVVTKTAPTTVAPQLVTPTSGFAIAQTAVTTVRTPAAPSQAAPMPAADPARARPMRATLPASVPQATVASTVMTARSGGPENTPRTATIAASPAVAPPTVVAPIATPPVVQTGVASFSIPGAPSRFDAMLGGKSTFWTRSLPLMAVAGTGFLFLLWARDIALERERRAVPVTRTTIINNTSAPGAPLNNTVDDASETENGVTVANGATGAASVTNNRANGATTNGAASTAAPSAPATTSNAVTPNATSTAVRGANATSSTQPPTIEPQIAPSGLIVSNAPAPTRIASSSAGRTSSSQRESTPRTFNRRAEPTRTRRASRSENQERPSFRPRYAASGLATNNSDGSSILRQPDARLIPPASVTQLPRAQESSSGASSNDSGNALPPVGSDDSTSENGGNGGLRPYAGPLPSFPSPAQVQSRAQSEIRPRPSSRASEDSSGTGEAAYQYQTRALTYVEQGDNARAVGDFQSAIALYRRQIARGESVAEARRGLEACQKGLRLISAS